MEPQILIVEDDAALRKGMITLLRMQGLAVSGAVSIADARRQITATVPTHLILDLNLPDVLGTELLRYIRHQDMQTRVMVLSGSAETHILAEARELGVDAIAAKPPDWEKVVQWASSK